MLVLNHLSFDRLFSALTVLFILVDGYEFRQDGYENCQEPQRRLKLTFRHTGRSKDRIHFRQPGFITTFGNIDKFYNTNIDFKVSKEINEDELYSVILIKQTGYARLEPNGNIRLKWFVANIPGRNLTKGKAYWDGTILAEYEPMEREDSSTDSYDDYESDTEDDGEEGGKKDQEYHLLWIFKHVDKYTRLEDRIQEYERNNFALQIYYDYLCSRPHIEVAFAKRHSIPDLKTEINSAKRMQN